MRRKALLAGTLLSLCLPLAAAAAPPDEAIRYRQGVLTAMEWNLSRMAAMVQGRVPFEADRFRQRAERLVLLGEIVDEGFADAASARGDGEQTRASYRIWEAPARFAQLMEEMRSRSQALQQAAAEGQSRAALRPLVGRLAQSCKACHDKYRD